MKILMRDRKLSFITLTACKALFSGPIAFVPDGKPSDEVTLGKRLLHSWNYGLFTAIEGQVPDDETLKIQ